jgi:NADPH:quinone reductase-like Zn-dependent oxidoreductase
VVPAEHLDPKPAEVPWEVAGSLPVAGSTAWAAVRAVTPRPGETVVVAGAAGGVGSIAVQLARRTGAVVVGLVGPANHDWLRGLVAKGELEVPVSTYRLADVRAPFADLERRHTRGKIALVS